MAAAEPACGSTPACTPSLQATALHAGVIVPAAVANDESGHRRATATSCWPVPCGTRMEYAWRCADRTRRARRRQAYSFIVELQPASQAASEAAAIVARRKM